MRTRSGFFLVAGTIAVVLIGIAAVGASASRSARSVPFEDARLKIEYNATDGDAGLQVFADSEDGWQEISVTNPAGHLVATFTADEVIREFGLTELFSESSEPPFTEMPFEQFKHLFPEGRYSFQGVTIDGRRLRGAFNLTHDVPDGPHITSPAPDSTVASDGFEVRWNPVTTPADVDVVAYEVIVIDDAGAPSGGERTVDATLPASATSFAVGRQFLVPGTYKVEVLAIDDGGNQTLNEVAFNVQ